MGAHALVKAAQREKMLREVAGLIATKAAQAKQSSAKSAKCSKSKKLKMYRKIASLALVKKSLTKQALVGELGAKMMRTGGKGLKGLSKILSYLGLDAASVGVRGAGSKLQRHGGMAELGHRMEGLKGGPHGNSPAIIEMLQPKGVKTIGEFMGKMTPSDRFKMRSMRGPDGDAIWRRMERWSAKAPEARRALGHAQLVGAGTLGAGGLGAASMLGGGEEEQPPIDPKMLVMLQQIQQMQAQQ